MKKRLNIELCHEFRSLEQWRLFRESNPHLFDPDFLSTTGAKMREQGAIEPLTGRQIPPRAMEHLEFLREGLVFSSMNSRIRAVLLVIQWIISQQQLISPKIYAAEAVTQFALKLRGIYPKFIGSEYATSQKQRDDLFPILSEDLLDLSFPESCFDLVTTNEVLEHVPSIDTALSEIYRVLKPGGWHIGTVPFLYTQNDSIVRAKIENGELVHLTEPEYHGNPIDDKGSLVFELPGWGVLARAVEIGFSDAHMKYIMSSRHACISEGIGGILVLCLQK